MLAEASGEFSVMASPVYVLVVVVVVVVANESKVVEIEIYRKNSAWTHGTGK